MWPCDATVRYEQPTDVIKRKSLSVVMQNIWNSDKAAAITDMARPIVEPLTAPLIDLRTFALTGE